MQKDQNLLKDNRFPPVQSMLNEVLRTGLKNLTNPTCQAQAEAAIRWAFYSGFIHGQHVFDSMQKLSSATHDKLQAGYLAEISTTLKALQTYNYGPNKE